MLTLSLGLLSTFVHYDRVPILNAWCTMHRTVSEDISLRIWKFPVPVQPECTLADNIKMFLHIIYQAQSKLPVIQHVFLDPHLSPTFFVLNCLPKYSSMLKNISTHEQ